MNITKSHIGDQWYKFSAGNYTVGVRCLCRGRWQTYYRQGRREIARDIFHGSFKAAEQAAKAYLTKYA